MGLNFKLDVNGRRYSYADTNKTGKIPDSHGFFLYFSLAEIHMARSKSKSHVQLS